MALLPDSHDSENTSHRGVVPAGQTGIFVFPVSPGRRYNMIVSGNTGGTFTIGYYLHTAQDDVADGLTRAFAADVENITDAQKNVASVSGMRELGINVTAASSSDIQVELRECDYS